MEGRSKSEVGRVAKVMALGTIMYGKVASQRQPTAGSRPTGGGGAEVLQLGQGGDQDGAVMLRIRPATTPLELGTQLQLSRGANQSSSSPSRPGTTGRTAADGAAINL